MRGSNNEIIHDKYIIEDVDQIHFYHELKAVIDRKQCHQFDWLLQFIDLNTLISSNSWTICIHDETKDGLTNVVLKREINLKDILETTKDLSLAQKALYRKLYLVSKSLYYYAITQLKYIDIHKYTVSVFYTKRGLLSPDRYRDVGTYITRKPLIDIINNIRPTKKPYDDMF